MIQLKQKELKAFATRYLLEQQGGVCAICGLPVDYQSKTDMVVDHDHITGEIRGVLHRTCNTAEGKIRNLVVRWGSRTSKPDDVNKWLAGLVKYLSRTQFTGVMYPGAKTAEQREELARVRRNELAAKRRAAAKLKSLSAN